MDTGRSISFKCSVHCAQISESGLEEVKVTEGSGIHLLPNSLLSSLAADVLSDMFQKKEIGGKVIMKADNAKVYIQIRDNWKAHPLSDYTVGDDQEVTLQEAFGDLLFLEDTQITIHIHLCQERNWNEDKVRVMIKKLLESHSQTALERLQCPFSQGMLSQISRDQYPCKLSSEKIKMFGAWYERSRLEESDDKDTLPSIDQKSDFHSSRGKKIVFSPVYEIPALRSWYEKDPKPTAKEMTKFADILNTSEFRQSHEPVTFRHVNTWFKNERARLRRESLMDEMSRPSMVSPQKDDVNN